MFDQETRERIKMRTKHGANPSDTLEYIEALEQIALRAREFWHTLPLDAILTTPRQVGACTRLEDALARVGWMREEGEIH